MRDVLFREMLVQLARDPDAPAPPPPAAASRPFAGTHQADPMADPTEEEVDNDAVAAEWEAMMADEDDDGDADGDDVEEDGFGEAASRVLNQDEIDSLLGFDSGDGEGGREFRHHGADQ